MYMQGRALGDHYATCEDHGRRLLRPEPEVQGTEGRGMRLYSSICRQSADFGAVFRGVASAELPNPAFTFLDHALA
jgi:hypothetical protein